MTDKSDLLAELVAADATIKEQVKEIERLKKEVIERQETFGPVLKELSEEIDRLELEVAKSKKATCADPMREAMRRFTTLPGKGTPAADLTEGEKLALCIAAGAPTETVMEGGFLTVRTTVPCGVADRGDGGYIVAVGGES